MDICYSIMPQLLNLLDGFQPEFWKIHGFLCGSFLLLPLAPWYEANITEIIAIYRQCRQIAIANYVESRLQKFTK